jgi:hypothetical protein
VEVNALANLITGKVNTALGRLVLGDGGASSDTVIGMGTFALLTGNAAGNVALGYGAGYYKK